MKGPGKTVKTKVVKGTEEANAIFKDFHDSSSGAHTGQRKNRDSISQRFFWPGMSADIDKWVKADICSVLDVTRKHVRYITPPCAVKYPPLRA